MIAIALGIKNWSVRKTLDCFPEIMQEAFSRKVIISLRRGKYRTQPLGEVLTRYHMQGSIFGGRSKSSSHYERKVAVTSATETANHAVIFTNYNRADDGTREAQDSIIRTP
jgi:hypothetical protein